MNKYMEENKQEMLSLYLTMYDFPQKSWFLKALAAAILGEKIFRIRTLPTIVHQFVRSEGINWSRRRMVYD